MQQSDWKRTDLRHCEVVGWQDEDEEVEKEVEEEVEKAEAFVFASSFLSLTSSFTPSFFTCSEEVEDDIEGGEKEEGV